MSLPAGFRRFDAIVVEDFEFHQPPGDCVREVAAYTALEVLTGREVSYKWRDLPARPPFGCDPNTLRVAFYASAEWQCYARLGWPLPQASVDLYAEHRLLENTLDINSRNAARLNSKKGFGLLAACIEYGIKTMDADSKELFRDIAIAGPDVWTPQALEKLVEYNRADVAVTAELFYAMAAKIDLDRALLRGAYVVCTALIEAAGIPVDVDLAARLKSQAPEIRQRLIAHYNPRFQVYDDGGVFKQDLFASYLDRHALIDRWPKTKTGALSTSDETLEEMALRHPPFGDLRQLRKTIKVLERFDMPIGSDGRTRVMSSVFGTITARNTPSNSKFVFGLAKPLRSLMRPEPGKCLMYADWSGQEAWIAAFRSGDMRMQEAVRTGDPYIHTAKLAAFVPADATKVTHPTERDSFKVVFLGLLYGRTAYGLGRQLGLTESSAEELVAMHHRLYPAYWRWSDEIQLTAENTGHLSTRFGWRIAYPAKLRGNAKAQRTRRTDCETGRCNRPAVTCSGSP